MGHQIVKQPNGKLCLFSTERDEIVLADASPDDLRRHFDDLTLRNGRRETERLLGYVLAGEPRKAYYQFTRTYEQVVETHRWHGGEERLVYGTPEWEAENEEDAAEPVPPLDLTPCEGCRFTAGGITAGCEECARRHPARYAKWARQMSDELDELREKVRQMEGKA
jgi:hypothetical protein